MPHRLRISVTFLDRRFHGRRDGGEPEWPPSPLRLFQAIVASAAAGSGKLPESIIQSLRWLETLPPPSIRAPSAVQGAPYRLSVPNNAMDLVAKAWSQGKYDGAGDANPATHRTMKTVRPTVLVGGDRVDFVWTLPLSLRPEDERHARAVAAAARSVVSLGWGVDLVVADGSLLGPEDREASFDGDEWLPRSSGEGSSLRSPRPGTLDALIHRHAAFLRRLGDFGFSPVPPLTVYTTVAYRRASDPPPRPVAAFSLLMPDASRPQVFSTGRRTLTVAGMMRHALATAALAAGWEAPEVNAIVHGHSPDGAAPAKSDPSKPRFAYVPLPSIHWRGVGAREQVGDIRRALLVGNEAAEAGGHFARAARLLVGGDLIEEQTGEAKAMLAPLARSERAVQRFMKPARVWASVTPVVLDRHPKARSRAEVIEGMERVVSDACVNAGLPRPVRVLVSPAPFVPGAPHAFDFAPFRRKDGSAPSVVHVRLVFPDPVAGPVLVGAGRFRGYGLLTPYDANGAPDG